MNYYNQAMSKPGMSPKDAVGFANQEYLNSGAFRALNLGIAEDQAAPKLVYYSGRKSR